MRLTEADEQSAQGRDDIVGHPSPACAPCVSASKRDRYQEGEQVAEIKGQVAFYGGVLVGADRDPVCSRFFNAITKR